MPDINPPSPSSKGGESKPPRPKPVPANAAKPQEPDPAKGQIISGKFKIKKMEANQPRQRRIPPTPIQFPKLEKKPSLFQIGWNYIRNLGKDTLIRISAAIIIVGAILTFFIMRETRLQVAINSGERTLQPEAFVVFDFTERIALLKKDLALRLEPLQASLDEAQGSLGSAQADLAGRVQSKKLLQDTIEQDEKKMSDVIQNTRDKLKSLWDEEFKKIDDGYEKSKAEFNKKIAERAQSLKLQLTKNSELDVPEVTVNSFRLALYGAPKEIDVNAQRTWAEDLLKQWRDEEAKRTEKRAGIRKQIQEVREPVGGKIEDIKTRIAGMKNEIVDIDNNLGMVKDEISRFEERVADLKKQIRDTIQPFYEDLLRVPADYLHFSYTIQPDGALDVRDIDKNREFKPGKHKLLLRAVQNGEEYWTLVDFEIKPYKTTKFTVTPDQFIPARSLLIEK